MYDSYSGCSVLNSGIENPTSFLQKMKVGRCPHWQYHYIQCFCYQPQLRYKEPYVGEDFAALSCAKQSEPSEEGKLTFSDSPSQNSLRPFHKIEWTRILWKFNSWFCSVF